MLLRGLLSPAEVETLRAGVERNLASLGPLGMNATKPGEPGAFVEDFRNWQRIPEYEQVFRDLGARAGRRRAACARAPCGSSTTTCWSRSPGRWTAARGTRTSRTTRSTARRRSRSGSRSTRSSRPSTLEFVAGSHAEGKWYMPRSFVKGTAMVFDEGALEEVPDVEADRDAWPIVGWAMEPGDAVAFNMLTLHAAAGSPTRRRVVSLRLTGDDVRWAPRPHRTSPPFPEVDLPARRAARPRGFPVLWRAV